MKTLILGMLLVSSLSMMGAFPKALIKNFKGNYKDGAGKAFAQSFIFEKHDFGESPEFNVEKQGTSLYLQTGDQEFELKNLPLFADDVKGLKWDGLQLGSNAERIDLTLASFLGQHTDKLLKINGLRVICENSGAKGKDEYFDSCLNHKGHISFAGIESTSKGKKTSLGRFSLSTSNKRFRFSVKASGNKVKGKGEIYYEGHQVRIKIREAKAGPFSVRKKLFKELRKARSSKVAVKNPWIIITL